LDVEGGGQRARLLKREGKKVFIKVSGIEETDRKIIHSNQRFYVSPYGRKTGGDNVVMKEGKLGETNGGEKRKEKIQLCHQKRWYFRWGRNRRRIGLTGSRLKVLVKDLWKMSARDRHVLRKGKVGNTRFKAGKSKNKINTEVNRHD